MTPQQLKCAAQHFGPWWVEAAWMANALAAYRAGVLVPTPDALPRLATIDPAYEARILAAIRDHRDSNARPVVVEAATKEDRLAEDLGFTMFGSVAKIPIIGQMTKGDSSFGGTSSIRTRQAIRRAVSDDKVRAILMAIDSPGGTVAGTVDLADDMAKAATVKPVWAHMDDLGASAAFFVAASADRITANRNAVVGSIGTVAVLTDTSKMAEDQGATVHVLSTGPNKGTGIPGAPITDGQLAAQQELVDDLGQQFVDHVNSRRGTSLKLGKGAADGRLLIADKALAAGLIDAVQPFGATLAEMQAALAVEDAEAIARARVAQEGLLL